MTAWHRIKGRGWIFAIPIVVFTLVGTALILLDVVADPVMRPGPPWYESFLFLGIFFILAPWIATLWVVLFIKRGQREERDLLERGIRGEATLISISETGLYTNNIPQVEMVLDIRWCTHPEYRVVHREHVNLIDLPILVPGRELAVVIDPDNHDNILVLLRHEHG